MICDYGCGQEGKYQLKNRKWCCSKSQNSCPILRKKFSESHKGEKNYWYGKYRSEETKRKMSENHADVSDKNHPMYGKHHTEESKKKNREKQTWQKGKNNPMYEVRLFGEKNPFYGKSHTEKSKSKMRVAKQGLYEGKNNPNWKGGVSKFPYASDWGPKVKRKVLERDNHVCQKCGEIENLAVHHIDYNKMKCDSTNLITLCNVCNGKANFEREEWQKLYEEIMMRRVK